MNTAIQIYEKPKAKSVYLIAGWRQWADAGSVSSNLPEYLIDYTNAKKIGEIKSDDFYLFQIPSTHYLFRPDIKLDEGYRKSLEQKRNEFFYAPDDENDLVIFLGDEPHLNVEGYAKTFFEALDMLGVNNGVGLGGVYGEMPYDKDREISCVYSLPDLKTTLENYAVRFSNYEGGATISTYLIDMAARLEVNFCAFYAFVPAYDFAEGEEEEPQGVRIENDFKAWYDLMRRINHLFDLHLDLSDLAKQSNDLIAVMDDKIEQLSVDKPNLDIKQYLQGLEDAFQERSFIPLGDVWERELSDLLEDFDDERD
ncbi:MAG: PAC2 family protein [Chloroflexota bacterium]